MDNGGNKKKFYACVVLRTILLIIVDFFILLGFLDFGILGGPLIMTVFVVFFCVAFSKYKTDIEADRLKYGIVKKVQKGYSLGGIKKDGKFTPAFIILASLVVIALFCVMAYAFHWV